MFQRNLPYTGITWARKLVVLAGSRRALAAAIRTKGAGRHHHPPPAPPPSALRLNPHATPTGRSALQHAPLPPSMPRRRFGYLLAAMCDLPRAGRSLLDHRDHAAEVMMARSRTGSGGGGLWSSESGRFPSGPPSFTGRQPATVLSGTFLPRAPPGLATGGQVGRARRSRAVRPDGHRQPCPPR